MARFEPHELCRHRNEFPNAVMRGEPEGFFFENTGRQTSVLSFRELRYVSPLGVGFFPQLGNWGLFQTWER